jgi:uncharacterized membrane protein
VTESSSPARNGKARPDRAHSRFFCNRARTASLLLGLVAIAALVVGAVLAEVSSSGAPTSTQTAVVRWIILAALVGAVVAYVIGGRLQRRDG